VYRITVFYEEPSDAVAFDAYYQSNHTPLVLQIPGLRRFTTSHPRSLTGTGPWFVAEMWFEDRVAFKAAIESAEMQAAADDAPNLATPHVIVSGRVHEAAAPTPSE
jgi:uncharacterized protein (TIGR02118 family)